MGGACVESVPTCLVLSPIPPLSYLPNSPIARMPCMKLPRFSTRFLLLITTFVAITCGGWLYLLRMDGGDSSDLPQVLVMSAVYSPIWLPLVFLAYAIGRGALSVKIIAGFATCEAAVIGLVQWLIHL